MRLPVLVFADTASMYGWKVMSVTSKVTNICARCRRLECSLNVLPHEGMLLEENPPEAFRAERIRRACLSLLGVR
jgi:hypothetical protein